LASVIRFDSPLECKVDTATHCNMLQLTATHCNIPLQHTATRCNTLQHTATHCNPLQHTATRCNTLQHAATHCNAPQHTATHCNALQQLGEASTIYHHINPVMSWPLNQSCPSSTGLLNLKTCQCRLSSKAISNRDPIA